MDATLQDRLRQLISSQLGVELDEVVTEARILDDLCADSLDVVELVMALEEAFDIVVPDEDVEGMQTIGDVEAYLTGRVSG
jgi:acyl carrier protein